tara:strand:- start:37 stop:699 length:663 start_codon:yes stop_codon:yes gene_type:complete
MQGQEFLTQEEAVVAHLYWAMLAVERVTIQVAGKAVAGRMLSPDPDSRAVVFEPDPGQDIPERALRKGKIVLAKYASLSDEYQFKTQLMEVGPATWLLSIPRDIRRNDRRMILRRNVQMSRRITIQLQRSDGSTRMLLLHDLSPAGLGIVYDPQLDQFEEGQVLKGDLHIPGHDAITVRFEVVNVRTLGEHGTHRIVGCRFQGLGFEGCARVARALEGED